MPFDIQYDKKDPDKDESADNTPVDRRMRATEKQPLGSEKSQAKAKSFMDAFKKPL